MGAYSYGVFAVKNHIQIIATHCPEIDQSGNLVGHGRTWSAVVWFISWGSEMKEKNEIAKACLLALPVHVRVRAREHWPPVLRVSSSAIIWLRTVYGDGVRSTCTLPCGVQRSLWIVGLEVYINKDAHRYGVIRSPLWDKCSPS